jgi:hypothetical protein
MSLASDAPSPAPDQAVPVAISSVTPARHPDRVHAGEIDVVARLSPADIASTRERGIALSEPALREAIVGFLASAAVADLARLREQLTTTGGQIDEAETQERAGLAAEGDHLARGDTAMADHMAAKVADARARLPDLARRRALLSRLIGEALQKAQEAAVAALHGAVAAQRADMARRRQNAVAALAAAVARPLVAILEIDHAITDLDGWVMSPIGPPTDADVLRRARVLGLDLGAAPQAPAPALAVHSAPAQRVPAVRDDKPTTPDRIPEVRRRERCLKCGNHMERRGSKNPIWRCVACGQEASAAQVAILNRPA